MTTIEEHKKDKKLLTELTFYLNISLRNLRKNELNYWILKGRKGFIDADGKHCYLHLFFPTRRSLLNCKRTQEFGAFTVETEAECIIRLDKYPNEENAEKIRKYIGFSRKPRISEIGRENLRKNFKHGNQTR